MRSERRRAKVGGLAASMLAHALVLAVLAWSAAPRLGAIAPDRYREMEVRLVDPPPLAGRPASRVQAASEPDRTLSPVPPRPVATPSPQAPAAPPALAAATKGSGSPAPSAATGPGVAIHPGPLPGAEGAGDFKGFLRAGVGCAHRDGVALTRAEREACDQKAGEVAKAAPTIDRIAPEKRAYYDAVAAAQAAMRYATPVVRTPVLGGNMYTDPPTAMPGRMVSLTCSPFLLLKGAKNRLPPHSLVAGPCAIIPPVGPLNPDNDVPPPASLKEREAEARKLKALDPPAPSDAPVSPSGR